MNLIKEKGTNISDEFLLRGIFKKTFLSSALAIVCSCIGQIVGNIVIGNVFGESKLAVMSLVLPVYYIFATIGNFAGIGGSAVCAMLIGKRKNDECKKVFTVTYILTLALCLFFSVIVLLLLPQVAKLLGAGNELNDDVKTYCAVLSAGGLFIAGIYLSFNFLRLDGRNIATILTFVIMAVINVGLDIALAKMNVAGIALATVLGGAAATVFGFVYILLKSEQLGFMKVSLSEFFELSGKIFKVGSPGATENVSILLKSYFLNRLIVSVIGVAALSSLSVVNSINSISMAITVGSAGAIVPLIGVFSAEKDMSNIRKTVSSALKFAGFIIVVFSVLTAAFAYPVAQIFGITGGIKETAFAIRIFAISLPFALLNNLLIYLHLANKYTFISNLLTALRCCVFAVGIAFIFMKLFGETGLWLSFVGCEAATLAAAAVYHTVKVLKNRSLSPILLLDTTFEKDGTLIEINTYDDEESILKSMEQLRAFCEKNDISAKRSMIITLSMDEMLHMAAQHSTRSGKHHIISIRVCVFKDILILRLRYVGKLFNPIEYYESKKTDSNDIDALLELADCMGMKMVTDTCDVVDYKTTFGINNLTIIL